MAAYAILGANLNTQQKRGNNSVQGNAAQAHGDVVPRLAALRVRAEQQWGVKISQHRLARLLGVSSKRIGSLCQGTTQHYDLMLLGQLCWYFGCPLPDLLTYLPPGPTLAPLPEVQVRRTHLPASLDLPPKAQLVHTRLPAVLHSAKIVDLMHATGLKRDTLAALRDGKPRRVARSTLAAVCDAAQQAQGSKVGMNDVLSVDEGSWC